MAMATEQSNESKDNENESSEFTHVGSVNLALDFDINDNGQEEINKFGYYFDKTGCCLSLQNNQRPNKFETRDKFEEFGALIEKYIFYLLRHQYKLIGIQLKSLDKSVSAKKKKKKKKKAKKTTIMSKLYSPRISESKIEPLTIFFSSNYQKQSTLLLLIPGSGSVRAAQWSRSACINDNLCVGTMFPFISAAIKRKWSVMLLDPNGRMENNKREYSDNHLLFVYDKYIKPHLCQQQQENKSDEKNEENNIENILIVCHSAAGIATTRLLNERICVLPYIYGVAGTDVDFGRAKNEQTKKVFEHYVVNYRASYQPLDTMLSEKDEHPLRVSAGHIKHEYTNASSFHSIFKRFDQNLKT